VVKHSDCRDSLIQKQQNNAEIPSLREDGTGRLEQAARAGLMDTFLFEIIDIVIGKSNTTISVMVFTRTIRYQTIIISCAVLFLFLATAFQNRIVNF
jgi:hypothetical protein